MLEHITEALAAEINAGAVTPEDVRAFIHPRLDVETPTPSGKMEDERPPRDCESPGA